MNCPTCPDDKLVMTERSGIEIDYCPTCRGVWLDRGELDKIIERSLVDSRAEPPRETRDRGRVDEDRRLDDRDHRDTRFDDNRYDDNRSDDRFKDDRFDDDDRRGRPHKRRRRESLLGELFDF
jgi:uncharacterized protein